MEDFEREINELKNKINELEKKYFFINNYNMITSLLNKLNVTKIELNNEEITDKNIYIVEREEDKIIIKKED